MPRSIVALLALAGALLLAPAALAVDPLTVTSATPADRALVAPTPTGGIPWQVALSGVPDDAGVQVTVSTSPTTGPDGTLPTDDRVDLFALTPSGTPGGFAGRSDPGPNAWSAEVATYYWQVVATWTDAAGGFHSLAGPVDRLFIGTTPPPGSAPAPAPAPGSTPGAGGAGARTSLRMSSLDAPFYVRALIRTHTKRPPAGLHYGCARLNNRSFRCRPTWRDSRNVYSATATFTHAQSAGRIVAQATVTGRRASRQCTRTRSLASCRQPFRWHATTAARPLGAAR